LKQIHKILKNRLTSINHKEDKYLIYLNIINNKFKIIIHNNNI
jgi:hypothetical protein